MTVKELICELLNCDLDKEIYVADEEYNTKKADIEEWKDSVLIVIKEG